VETGRVEDGLGAVLVVEETFRVFNEDAVMVKADDEEVVQVP
jgi:hypothetical protein